MTIYRQGLHAAAAPQGRVYAIGLASRCKLEAAVGSYRLAAFIVLGLPMALLAVASGLGLLPLPYQLFLVLQRTPIAFSLHMIASGLALLLIPVAVFMR